MCAQGASALAQDGSLVSSMALPPPSPLPTKTQGAVHGEAAQPRLSFLALGPSASKVLGMEGQ